ncbi:hypothetical protein NQ176_g11311 [Zarea fungicola]|uniref:Uncharacterized protein n=1 Tax=Zarea fungicola TaxID=93591 RepID=A0ACC1MAX5_9HYPO|nr:hypothetical protein NQ176_g11311 [Lecanicillium fungicola]
MLVELAIGVAANLPLESRDVSIWYPMPAEIVQPNLMEVEKTGLPSLTGSPESESESEEEEEPEQAGKSQKAKPTAPLKEPKRVRFAGFVALEVKGRQVLAKAPVWTL